MTTSAPRPAIPLTLLIERHFLADCCARTSERYQWSFGAAVRLWGADLGREPTTADLSIESLATFIRHLRHAGRSDERIRESRSRLRTLWGYAHRRGLASEPGTVKVDGVAGLPALPSCDSPAKPPRVFLNNLFDQLAERGTARHYFQTVYEPQQLADKDRTSLNDHRAVHRSLWKHYGGDILLGDQTDELAAEHFAWMAERGKSDWAIRNIQKTWFAQWRHAHDRKLVPDRPTIKLRKVTRGAPDAWTIDEMRRLLAVASPWWRAILLVGYWTLQRRRALFNVPRSYVDLDGGWVDFPPTANKVDVGVRARIGRDAVAAVRDIWPSVGERLFERQRNSHRQFRELVAAAGIRPSLRKNGQFHKLRRTGATHAVIKGGMSVVCDLLGHTAIYVTKRYIDKTQLPGHDVTRLLPLLMEDTAPTERSEP